MEKPARPPDVQMSLDGWDDLTEEERAKRMEEFLAALSRAPDEHAPREAEVEPNTTPKAQK